MKALSRTAALGFQRTNFGLSRDLVDTVPCEAIPHAEGLPEGRTFFEGEILMVQEQAVPVCPKLNWWERRPARLIRELFWELRKGKRVYELWKQGQAAQEDTELLSSCSGRK